MHKGKKVGVPVKYLKSNSQNRPLTKIVSEDVNVVGMKIIRVVGKI